jgi:type II restriction/modification system DNA methylase subunit YeeA
MSLRQLLDLEKEVINTGTVTGIPGLFPEVNPSQLYGIELNEYAHELAQATVWIGWIQWLHENGYGVPSEPILKRLDNIKQMDAILAFGDEGKPVEPEWPEAEVIVGNPPFLGGYKMRGELGSTYLDALFELYEGRVPGPADLVVYWFERARKQIASKKAKRVGSLATNSIRGGANRTVLERIKESGDIFWAQSDRDWILEGAAVRVSMIAFDDATETAKALDNKQISNINSDLSTSIDLFQAVRFKENMGIAFSGTKKGGAFDISEEQARYFLDSRGNPNGRSNSDVVKPWVNGQTLIGRAKPSWIIDFGIDMTEEEASMYELPFEHVKREVYPERQKNNRARRREIWWLHSETAPAMRRAIALPRYLATSRVSKYRLFVWVSQGTLPDDGVYVFVRDDDYFFGILHSHFHDLWALRMGTSLGGTPRYTPTTTFETFPFPWAPGQEPADDPCVQAIAQAAQELDQKRNAWLNPPGLSEAELKKRTLTNLYNARPTWLDLAHKKLDAAVAAAYGWPADLSDEEILARLLALNLARAAKQ